MGAVQYMFALALRPLLDGIGRSLTDPSARAEEIRTQLAKHLDERLPCLTRALHQANESAWQSLEVASRHALYLRTGRLPSRWR